MKQWKRLAALSSAIVMAAATLTYFPNDTLQNIRLELSASAETTTEPQVWIEDNLTWTLDADGTLTISGTGAMKDYNAAENLSPAYMNSDVKKVVIEKGVTSIGELAFYKCISLTNITIPDSVTCIEYAAFHGCSSLSSITIPNSVTSIGIYAFVVCSSLTSITIPDGVTSIGYGAFSDCSSLKTISLSCKSFLKKSDFGEQADLVSYTNQHLLTKTAAKAATCSEDGNKEYWTCEHCGKYFLSDDTNPATATAVELSETVIPALNHKNATTRGAVEPNGTNPGYSGDRYCPDCDTVFEKGYTYWNEDNLTWKLDADGTLTISGTGAMKNYKDGDQSPVFNNSNVKKVVIENGVTSIGNYAFSYTGLKSITIPDSVTSIGNYAFSYTDLKSITIPDRVTSIGYGAFYHCTSLTSITIPDRVTSIGFSAFSGCKNLTSITIPDSIISIGHTAFYNCSSLTSITIPDSVISIGDAAFKYCSNLKTISLSCKSTLKRSDFGDKADLVSYASHTLKKTAAKAKTCTEDGNKEYWTCEYCKKYFLSDDTNPETAKAVEQSETVIPASHKLTKVDAKAATCTEDGNKEYWTCEHCKKYFLSDDTNPETAKAVEQSETIIPALKHKNATTRGASEPTEIAPGYSGDRYCPDCDTVFEKGYTYWNEGNLTWKLYEDGKLTISGKGAMKNYNYYNNPSPAFKNSNVKKVVIEDGVTSIGNSAFDSCSSLTSITLSNNITNIGNDAFAGCRSLTSITIPDSVTSIGDTAFAYCYQLTSITIPDSVTSIGEATFYYCSGLTSITIPDSVTSIGSSAFKNCSNLTTISLSCKSTLKRSDFGEQTNLVSYTLHTLKKTAAKDATCSESGNKEYWTCEHCGKYFLSDDANPETATAVELSETVIPVSHKLTKVEAKDATCAEDGNKEYWTCEHCKKYFLSDDTNPETAKAVELSETVIPALKHKNATTRGASEPTETSPGYSGDLYCPDCDTVVEKGYTYWIEDNLTWKLYEDGTLNISGTGAMKDYNADDNPSPAYNNSKVKKIVIEKGVTSVGDYAFFYCTSLTSVTIPDNVTSIGNYAFAYTGLKSITIPDSVTSIGESTFKYCSNLKTISLSCKSSLKRNDFGEQADLVSYTNQHLLTKTAAKAATCTEDGNKEYWTCEHCGKYFLSDDTNPETAKAVEQAETVIPASHKLTKVEAKAVTCAEDGNKAYWTCEHCGKYFLSDDANPETAKAVELSETVIPALKHKNATTRGAVEPNETKPGYSGDRYCPDCDTVLEKGYTYWVEDNLTWKLYEDGTLNISGKGAMKNYNYYNNPSPAFKNSNVKKVVIEDGVTSIENSAFDSCSSLTSITIPDSVTSIGNSAFNNCSSLTSITIPDGVTSIGNSAFFGCSSLTSVTIPDSVTSIGNVAFCNCSSLTSITISDSVTSIEESTFYGCSSLTSITIPSSVTSIGDHAFCNCSSLTSITISDSVTSIGNDAFYGCSNLKTISLSCKSSLKKSDFGEQANLVSYASHTLKKTEAKAATCSEDGNKEYWTCEHCGKYFLSDDSNSETAKAIELSETVIPALVQIATTTTPIKCVYGQDMNKIDLRDYVKNTDVVGEVTVKVATGSTLPDGMKLDNGKISGKPAKAYEDGKEVTFTFTAENGNTANLTLLFLVAKADPTVEVSVSGDSHTEGDLVSELKLILSENSTKGVVELVSEIKALVAGKNTFTWKFTPEDENNYNMVTGTVVVNAQTTTTTTTTTKATTTTSKATTTTKPSKTTTTKATTTTKSSKTTTTKVTTTTKPSKTTTTNATTTTKPSKTTTTKATTTTKPSKTTTTKPSKTTTTKATTTTITTTTNTAIPSYGDVNLDGKVDIVDAIFLNKYLATLIQFSDAQVANADCCQDGVLNDQDTTALMQFIILLIDDLPVQPTEK